MFEFIVGCSLLLITELDNSLNDRVVYIKAEQIKIIRIKDE